MRWLLLRSEVVKRQLSFYLFCSLGMFPEAVLVEYSYLFGKVLDLFCQLFILLEQGRLCPSAAEKENRTWQCRIKPE